MKVRQSLTRITLRLKACSELHASSDATFYILQRADQLSRVRSARPYFFVVVSAHLSQCLPLGILAKVRYY
jgi:hypothetical protein